MERIARRSALALGVAAAAAPVLAGARPASAEAYGPDEGEELVPGVRVVELSSRESVIPGYASVAMVDLVFQPGSHFPESPMENEMVCHITAGELRIVKDGEEWRAGTGDVYTCATGTVEGARNEGDEVAVMRVIQLMPA